MKSQLRKQTHSDAAGLAGFLTIKKYRNGELVWQSTPLKNKVVSSDGYGRNLILRALAGDPTYAVEIDSAAIGTDATAPADGDTNLITPTVTGIDIADFSISNNVLNVDVFVPDGDLPDGTYQEFGLFADSRLMVRILISPAYTKASGEDTLFSYTLTLSG